MRAQIFRIPSIVVNNNLRVLCKEDVHYQNLIQSGNIIVIILILIEVVCLNYAINEKRGALLFKHRWKTKDVSFHYVFHSSSQSTENRN